MLGRRRGCLDLTDWTAGPTGPGPALSPGPSKGKSKKTELPFDGTSITAIAARAHVSRATIFWHFGDKATLFQEACRRILVPFIEELRKTLQHLDARKRLFELFNVYEQFVSTHQETIETFVRWALESHELRAQLQKPLFALHDEFARDIRESFLELWEDPAEAAELAAAFIAVLDGNLLLGLLETNPRNRELRSAGLRLLAERLLDAKPRGIKDGDEIYVYNDRGKIAINAWVTERIIPGVICIFEGSWYNPDENGIDQGACANTLTNDAYSGGGAAVMNTCLVQAVKA